MSIQLNAIEFSWSVTPTPGCAIRLRKNATEIVSIPEWTPNQPNLPDNSPAAYVINNNRNTPILIKAKFSTNQNSLKNKEVEIRAIQGPLQLAVMGDVKAQKVRFNKDGEMRLKNFEIENHRLSARGVGVTLVTWFWQYRTSPDELWQNIQATNHKIYTTLELPNGPWTLGSNDPFHLPWTEVLDYACTWANGARTLKQAGGLITKALYNLGPELLEYNCLNFLPSYVIPINLIDSYFDCTAFLLHLKTGLVNRFVICTDCAAIVSTFANALGCDLWQSKMYTPGVAYFKINPILAIGNFQWNLPCGFLGFAYHEVAWEGACTENDDVYDACLAIDQDLSPSFPPHIPYVPEGLRFGAPGSGLYRDRFAFPTDILLCRAQPGDRQRRKLNPRLVLRSSHKAMIKERPFDQDRRDLLKRQLKFDDWCDKGTLDDEVFIFNHNIPDGSLKSWQTYHHQSSIDVLNRPVVIDDIWRPANSPAQCAVKITKYETNSRREAHELLIQIMSNAHFAVPYHPIPMIGDIAFAGPNNQSILFARGNVVVVLTNVDRIPVDLIIHAKTIDNSFCQKEEVLQGNMMVKAGPKSKSGIRLTKDKKGKLKVEIRGDGKQKQQVLKASALIDEAPKPKINNIRLFSSGGEIKIENDELVVVPAKGKEAKVTAYFHEDQAMTRVDL